MSRSEDQDQKQVEMTAAAFLAGEGRRQKEIADKLNISQAAVSRYLKEAREENLLREEVYFLEEKAGLATMEKVRELLFRKSLQDELERFAVRHNQRPAKAVRVFKCDSGTNEKKIKSDRERMARLAELAAPHVRGLLLRARVCGLTWGGMLASLVAELRNLHVRTPWQEQDIQCIPLTGEPLGNDPVSYSSSSLAFELGKIINQRDYHAPSLAMVPAFIPEQFSEAEIAGVWKLIELVQSYRQIFGPHPDEKAVPPESTPPPLAEQLDMVLTSVGSSDNPMGFGLGSLFKTMSIRVDELRALIVAEIGGVCLARCNLERKQTKKFEGFRAHWTGLRQKHLEACAERGADPKTNAPGVVVVSVGRERAAVVAELVKRGLVNHLLVDNLLADELDKICRADGAGRPAE
jgi:predicted transcriptional regulator